jgi:hypothetical protein
MARLESVAVAGYYPTPTGVMARITSCLQVASASYRRSVTVMDPCAGEGEALKSISDAFKAMDIGIKAVAIEMEPTRYRKLQEKFHSGDRVNSDAFLVKTSGHVDFLYLNPPYDIDQVHGRLEQRFLDRFKDVLTTGGLLAFVVPFHALSASAELLASEFEDLACFRFPADEWDAYKQVVLFATKRNKEAFAFNARNHDQVLRWSENAAQIPVLEFSSTVRTIGHSAYLSRLEVSEVDLVSLRAETTLWGATRKRSAVVDILPGVGAPNTGLLMSRQYTLATPPRPAHIAAGLASGVFNGVRIVADDKESGLPDIMLKGMFNKEFKTVEEKKNKDGTVVAAVQIQQPKLVTTVLNMDTYTYHTVRNSTEITGTKDIAQMTMADLLSNYGKGMLSAMLSQCPILHDPAVNGDDVVVAKTSRDLFPAQGEAVKALVKILGGAGKHIRQRRNRGAFLLGEIGSGKTSVALATIKTLGAQKTLVMVPPHLIDGWKEQIELVCPEVKVVVLSSVVDVDSVATMSGPVIALLSRETAKLGHTYGGVKRCPACMEEAPLTASTKRLTCMGTVRTYPGKMKDLAQGLSDAVVGRKVSIRRLVTQALAIEMYDIVGDLLAFSGKQKLINYAVEALGEITDYSDKQRRASSWMHCSKDYNRELIQRVMGKKTYDGFEAWEKTHTSLWSEDGSHLYHSSVSKNWTTKKLEFNGIVLGSGSLINRAKRYIETFSTSKFCGEPLYFSTPEPRRYPLSTYILRKHRSLFDMLVLDEAHEYQSQGSAQEVAGHRMTALGIPTLCLTGSVMNGYADSLFTNLWALSPSFRSEFGHDDMALFVDRYGYRRVLTEDKDEKGEVIEFGSQSDRVRRTSRNTGRAPGVLPVLLFQHLLPISVTLHKADMSMSIPACNHHVVDVATTPEMDMHAGTMRSRIMERMRADRHVEGRSGALLGALAGLPSYYDLCTNDTGNTEGADRAYVVKYPDAIDNGAEVYRAAPVRDAITPKEAWMLEKVRASIAAGRNVMIFGWHSVTLARLSRLVTTELGEACPILDASKVPTKTRQAWITKEVVKKKHRVLVTNPVSVQTGLNNLTWFSDIIWMENPSCNPIVFRQAVGRIDRIGQEKETNVWFPVYGASLQEAMHNLLMRKTSVSMSTDGLDAESAMAASGIGEETDVSSLSIGRFLYQILAD